MPVNNVRHPEERINIEEFLEENRSLAEFTTFKVGGPARYFLQAENWQAVSSARSWAAEKNIPFLLIGGGANLLVADRGFPGLAVCSTALRTINIEGTSLIAEGGADVSSACEAAAEKSLSGLEFIYRMPGTVGGAVWMNARCYSVSVSDRLEWVDFIDFEGKQHHYTPREGDFSYKVSPFQDNGRIITRAAFKLTPGDRDVIQAEMDKNRRDREIKGHFLYPCAGSVFKNNRDFGAPTGRLVDGLGLKGTRRGGAQIAPFHGNIIINRDNASATDILALIELTEKKVKQAYGFQLEREVLLVGDWT